MLIFVSSLSFAGYNPGYFKWYFTTDKGYTYISKDTVISNYTITICSRLVDAASYISEDTTLYTWDILNAYYDGEFLTDALNLSVLSPYRYPIYLRLLRFPLVLLYTWQVVDTCIQPANRMFPVGDLDSDGIDDSLRVDSTHIRITFLSSDSVKVETDTLKILFRQTRPIILYADSSDTIMYKNIKNTYKFVLKAKYIPYVGYEYMRADTAEYIYEYDYIRTSTSDSAHISFSAMLPEFFIKNLVDLSTAEGHIIKEHGTIYELYDVSGRVIQRGTVNLTNLRRGIYFIKGGSRIKKIIVR